MPSTKRISERTAALLKKQQQLEERIKRSMSRDNSTIRKARNHALVQIGIAIEARIKQQPSYVSTVHHLAVEHLKPNKQKVVISFLDDLTANESTRPPANEALTSALPPTSQQKEDGDA